MRNPCVVCVLRGPVQGGCFHHAPAGTSNANPTSHPNTNPNNLRGSMRYVHITCLNEWRTMSSNSNSFYQCDQCGYRYNMMRTEWASWLESSSTATAAAWCSFIIILAISSLFFAILAQILGWNPACIHFYELVGWYPFEDPTIAWLWGPRLDAFVGGCLVVGISGLVLSAFERIQNDDFDYRGLLLTVLANDERILRVFVVLGVCYSFTMLHEKAIEICKRLLTRFGEVILEVQ